jgi:hypothetical protein
VNVVGAQSIDSNEKNVWRRRLANSLLAGDDTRDSKIATEKG